MSAPTQSYEIRAALRNRLLELAHLPDTTVQETLLIRDGCYCGRRFVAGSFSAVWFIEEGEIKIYGPAGTLLESHRAMGLLRPRTAA